MQCSKTYKTTKTLKSALKSTITTTIKKDQIKLSIEKEIYKNNKTILIIIQVSRPNGVLFF